MFNLPVPPGFRGLDPNLPLTVYHRHLPHWRQEGATYAVTFRLADALPQVVLRQLRQIRRAWEVNHAEPRDKKQWDELAHSISAATERSLDMSQGCCYFAEPEHATLLANALTHFNDIRYSMFCYVVMPNHCHCVVRPFEGHPLEKILQSIKGFVSRVINRSTGRRQTVWQEESYDQIVRDEEHLYRIVQYLGRNPWLAGIDRAKWVRWISPRWQEVGWDFEEAEGKK